MAHELGWKTALSVPGPNPYRWDCIVLSGWAFTVVIWILTKGKHRQIFRYSGKFHGAWFENWSEKSEDNWCWHPLDAKRVKDELPQKLLKGSDYWHLICAAHADFRHLSSRDAREWLLLLQAWRFVLSCCSSYWKLIQLLLSPFPWTFSVLTHLPTTWDIPSLFSV